MKALINTTSVTEVRLRNIIEVGLDVSGMLRLFEKGSKDNLRSAILREVWRLFESESKTQFHEFHASFCDWGTHNIRLAEKTKNGIVTKQSRPASYGQIAKTLDVVLKVAVYYSHLPDCRRSQLISRWLNAAVDNKMMAFLRRYYPQDIKLWPTTIERVDKSAYAAIQETVRKFINEKHGGSITPVQFDDIYWEALNRPEASSVK